MPAEMLRNHFPSFFHDKHGLAVVYVCNAFHTSLHVLLAGPKTVDDFIYQPLTQQEVEVITVLWEESCSCLGKQSCTCGLNNGDDKLFPAGRIHTYTCCLTHFHFLRLRVSAWLNDEVYQRHHRVVKYQSTGVGRSGYSQCAKDIDPQYFLLCQAQ